MTVLVIGGAASGKSAYAESLLCRLSGAAPKYYVATMEPHGAEAAARIARHREARAGRGFRTLERFTDLAGLRVPHGSAVLLEDLGNLCANELFLSERLRRNPHPALRAALPQRGRAKSESGRNVRKRGGNRSPSPMGRGTGRGVSFATAQVELFPQGSEKHAEASILTGVRNLRTQCACLVIVSNEIFQGGTQYEGDTLSYLRTLARLHRRLAQASEGVCEVVCGVPLYYKGAELFANP